MGAIAAYSDHYIDYSDGMARALDETTLSEDGGICAPAVPNCTVKWSNRRTNHP